MPKSIWRRCFNGTVSAAVIIALVVTTVSAPAPALQHPSSQDNLAPESSFRPYQDKVRARRGSKALLVVDTYLVSRVPDNFRQQVDFLKTIQRRAKATEKPTVAAYKHFLACSGFLTSRVFEELSSLQEIERKGKRTTADEQEKLWRCRAALRQLVEYLPAALEGKKSWEGVDPREFKVDPLRPGVASHVADALEHLGWEFALVEGKARIRVKSDWQPAALIPQAKAAVQPFSTYRALAQGTSRIKDLVRAGPGLPIKPGRDFAPHRKKVLGEKVHELIDAEAYDAAARLLLTGTGNPALIREAAHILHDDLGAPFSALLFSKIPPETAAYLISGMIVEKEKPVWDRDISGISQGSPTLNRNLIPVESHGPARC